MTREIIILHDRREGRPLPRWLFMPVGVALRKLFKLVWP